MPASSIITKVGDFPDAACELSLVVIAKTFDSYPFATPTPTLYPDQNSSGLSLPADLLL